jgi:hypothetical protein
VQPHRQIENKNIKKENLKKIIFAQKFSIHNGKIKHFITLA